MTSWPYYDEKTIDLVSTILRSGKVNYWTGEFSKKFEENFAHYMGRTYGISVCNGTVSLEIALEAMGIGEGDEVIVSPRSFFASTSCVIRIGAKPVFSDIDPKSQNMCPVSLKALITPQTRAIIPVHLAGWPCEMDEIMSIAQEYSLYVIEDCAQAHGAKYKGRYVGSIGHVGSFSFCQDKIMSTGGEGGMVITSDETLYEKMWALKDHGKNRLKASGPRLGTNFKWVHDSFGTNYRMTEIQSAIGLYQLDLLEEWVEKRNILAQIFLNRLRSIKGIKVYQPASCLRHAYYRFYCFIDEEIFPNVEETKTKILQKMHRENIPCFFGSCPEIYKEKAVSQANLIPKTPLKNAVLLGKTSLMFLLHPYMEENNIGLMCGKLEKHMNTLLKKL